MGFLVTANAKLLAQHYIYQKCIVTKPYGQKVLQVTPPQACRLDLFWGSGCLALERAETLRSDSAVCLLATRWQCGAVETRSASCSVQAWA